MKQVMLAATAIALAGCANFTELEAAALDAGRAGAGGSAGGTSGGSAGGTSGGSAGGMSGGSAGGMSGGSAGGMSGGSAGGTSGGSAGGTSGGSAGGGSAGLTLEAWSGTVTSRTTATYAIAASAVDGLVVEAYADADGGTRVRANSASVLSQVVTGVAPADLDARFGMATVVLNDTLWLFAGGQWSRSPPGPVGTFLTAPIYRRGLPTFVSLYTYDSGTGALVETYVIEDGGFSGPSSTLAVPALAQPSRLRVRPDSNGTYGSIVSDTFYARIETTNPTSIDGSNDMLLVASSESQNSIVGGSRQGSTPGALFWFPAGETALNVEPDVRVDSQAFDAGGVFTHAVATNGLRHAAILGPARRNDVWSMEPDAGVALSAGEWAVFIFGAGQPRFISLGTAPRPPFDLAFGAVNGTHGLFVMANCVAPAADGGICSGAGSVIGFLAQP